MNIEDCSITTAIDLADKISDITLFFKSPIFDSLDSDVKSSLVSVQLDLVEQIQSLLSYLHSVRS